MKRLDRFMLSSFAPLLCLTFVICLFIVLMQFVWRFIDDMVGKGLGMDVLAELFFYASMTMVPMALPLAILLASLMVFGNLGEHFELTAIKAAGVSLLRIMTPLIVLIAIIAVGAFFFQNQVLPVAQTKMWTLLYSMRQKSPELEIPEGVFYDQIPGYNLFVQSKNHDTGTLYDVMIYDMSKGFDNARVILADSGRLATSNDKTHLFLSLWHGEQFENLREQGLGGGMRNVPYRRESFDFKEIMLRFDANFNRMDEGGIRSQYVGKNISELQATIDSVNLRMDSIGTDYAREIIDAPSFGVIPPRQEITATDDHGNVRVVEQRVIHRRVNGSINVDSLFSAGSSGRALSYIEQGLTKARRAQQEYEFKGLTVEDDRRTIRRHAIELQKKFTLSFACLIFFFIGAPLGAIIRKGGLGMPLVISVFLFIFYYIIDNTGQKMAREGHIAVWQGMWLSAAVLLPLGIFFTYKAMRDSAVFNPDAYRDLVRRLFGIREHRNITLKEVRIEDMSPAVADSLLHEADNTASALLGHLAKAPGYASYWLHGLDAGHAAALGQALDRVAVYMSNSPSRIQIELLNRLPVIPDLWVMHPARNRVAAYIGMILFPVGLSVWLTGLYERHRLIRDARKAMDTIGLLLKNNELNSKTDEKHD